MSSETQVAVDSLRRKRDSSETRLKWMCRICIEELFPNITDDCSSILHCFGQRMLLKGLRVLKESFAFPW